MITKGLFIVYKPDFAMLNIEWIAKKYKAWV